MSDIPPDWFIDPLIELMTQIAQNVMRTGVVTLCVGDELGLRLGIPPGQTIRIHTPAGPVDVTSEVRDR